ncbi:MAG: methyltransferase [Candidatus Limnocylindria bacterium]
MRYAMVAENPIERIGLASGMVPTPMLEPYGAAFARTLMVATKLGVFEPLADAPLTAPAVAGSCGMNERATEKILNLLVGMRYLQRQRVGEYRLTKPARTWLLESSRQSVRDMVLMKFLEWEWFEGLEDFARTGKPLDVHAHMNAADWGLYQRGMRAQAGLLGCWLVRRLPMPKGATTMLDIGGSHGYLSVALCRRHPDLRSVVLDLPEAVEQAAPLLAAQGMGDRVVHRAGDALTEDLGSEQYDLILAFSLVHHFDADTNRALAVRCARALRPGGMFVIGDLMRPESPAKASVQDLFYDLYFALTSQSGLWSFDEMASWQRAAKLEPRPPMHLLMGQGPGMQIGVRS